MKLAPADTTLLGKFADEAGCAATCHWRANYSIIHQGWQIRHGDGEAVLMPDTIERKMWNQETPEDVARWLKTLHPAP